MPVLEGDKENFPTGNFVQLEKLDNRKLEWLTPTVISEYFDQGKALKGNVKGRKLFMCEFVKAIECLEIGYDVFIDAKCSAQTKTSIDYGVKVHLDCQNRSMIKASCTCPAGAAPNAACKHVGAIIYAAEYYAVTGSIFKKLVYLFGLHCSSLVKVKQNPSCTELPQRWHIPPAGRLLPKVSVDQMLKVESDKLPPVGVTDFFFNRYIQGTLITRK